MATVPGKSIAGAESRPLFRRTYFEAPRRLMLANYSASMTLELSDYQDSDADNHVIRVEWLAPTISSGPAVGSELARDIASLNIDYTVRCTAVSDYAPPYQTTQNLNTINGGGAGSSSSSNRKYVHFPNLSPYVEYEFEVVAVLQDGVEAYGTDNRAVAAGLWTDQNVLRGKDRAHQSTPLKSVLTGSLKMTDQTPTAITMTWKLPRTIDVRGTPEMFTLTAARANSNPNPYAKTGSDVGKISPVKISVRSDVLEDRTTGERYFQGTLSGLEEAVRYDITVELSNAYASSSNKGPASAVYSGETLPYVPDGPPLDVQVTGTDAGFRLGNVQWLHPANDQSNGNVTGYYLTWYAVGGEGFNGFDDDGNGNNVGNNKQIDGDVAECTAEIPCTTKVAAVTAHTLRGLLPATDYTVKVAARTAFPGSDTEGVWGPNSSPATFRTRSELPPLPVTPSIVYAARTADSDAEFEAIQLQGLAGSTAVGAIQTVYIIRELRPDNGTCFDNVRGRYEAYTDCGGNCAAACSQPEADFNEDADCNRDGWCIVAKQTFAEGKDAREIQGSYNVTAEGIPRGVSYTWRVVVFTEPKLWSVSQPSAVTAPASPSAATTKSRGGGGATAGASVAVVLLLLLAGAGLLVHHKRKHNKELLSSLSGGQTKRGASASNPRQQHGGNGDGDGDGSGGMYDEAGVMESKVQGAVGADAGLTIPPMPDLGPVQSHEIEIAKLASVMKNMSR